jgi:hypothetical protein
MKFWISEVEFEALHTRKTLIHSRSLSSFVPTSDTRSSKLAVDKLESCLAVLLAVTLMDVGIVSVRAVRVCRIAVRLDSACICRASEA